MLDKLFYFIISFAKTNKQTERKLAGTPQRLWPITAGPDAKKIIIKKQEILKNTAIQDQRLLGASSMMMN